MKNTHTISSLLLLTLISCSDPKEQDHTGTADKATTETPANPAPLADNEDAADSLVDPGEPVVDITTLPAIVPPPGYEEIARADGDLDGVAGVERVVVYNLPLEEDATEHNREVWVYRATPKKWEVWTSSYGAVMSSADGGMMGDPFQNLSIERRAIVINHYGGSRLRWDETQRYRYQDGAFRLIGTTYRGGAPCDEWTEYDYNLSTGKATYRFTTENCDNDGEPVKTVHVDSTYTRKLKVLPTMDNFWEEGYDEVDFTIGDLPEGTG